MEEAKMIKKKFKRISRTNPIISIDIGLPLKQKILYLLESDKFKSIKEFVVQAINRELLKYQTDILKSQKKIIDNYGAD